MEGTVPTDIKQASDRDIPLIRRIAQNTWPDAFYDILSQNQISYMLDQMYHPDVLSDEMKNPNHQYLLINDNEGFVSIEFNFDPHRKLTKLHKLYILPQYQKKGLGRNVMNFLIDQTEKRKQKGLILNVNKHNPAMIFYRKMGFVKWKAEVTDIGKGFIMDDYVLKKNL